MNLWPALSTGSKTPRSVIALSKMSIISWPYKLVTGKQAGKGVWTGPVHPNATKLLNNDKGCPDGCVFNIETVSIDVLE